MSPLPRVVPRAPRVVLLRNAVAGRGRGARAASRAAQRLRAAAVEVDVVEGPTAADSLDLARAALASARPDALVAVGGDGTVHLALQALGAGSGRAGAPAPEVPLGLVPAGTGNDGVRAVSAVGAAGPAVGGPGAVDAAVDQVLAGLAGGPRRTVDLAVCGGRAYLTVLAAGFDAVVAERAEAMTWPRGAWRYPAAVAAELRRLTPLSYTLDLDGEVRRLEATLVAVGNGPSFGGGLRITEGARVDDGLLDVVLVRPLGRAELVRTFPRLYRGTHTTHPGYEHHRVRRVTVAAAGVTGYADGERLGSLPLTVEVRPAALTVLG